MTEPISPSEAKIMRSKAIPDEVLESFNELIVKNLSGKFSRFSQDDVIALILSKMGNEGRREEVFSNHWLDVEETYRKAGWIVEYDKPGYNEDYNATFYFKEKP